ncbi:unnamed protein product [Chironomus riparius]|uniref:Uncharacterized protein n=1 Tax=Chironomus riparius TaxID=315576 RepID=A0A9N9RJD7_9DIPT|nr:unnamed protein product [Chironomus riparius]
MSIECRLCGNISPAKIQLSDKIKGFLSFKEFVEYFCRIDLDDPGIANKLPTSVCQDCYYVLLNFCKFTITVEKLQNKFKNRLPQEEHPVSYNKVALKRKHEDNPQKESSGGTNDCNIKDESDSRLSIKRNKIFRTNDEIKAPEKHENNIGECLEEVYLLFKDDLEAREKQYEKVTIKESLLMDGGEIPRNWLERYRDFITWQDLSYQCSHCTKQIKSLNAFIKHFDELKLSTNKRIIKCHCGKIFKDQLFLISYINHVSKLHYNHLKFTCIFCSKVFVNVVKLSNHLKLSHGNANVKIFPCFDCGLICSTLDRLKQHKNCHEI